MGAGGFCGALLPPTSRTTIQPRNPRTHGKACRTRNRGRREHTRARGGQTSKVSPCPQGFLLCVLCGESFSRNLRHGHPGRSAGGRGHTPGIVVRRWLASVILSGAARCRIPTRAAMCAQSKNPSYDLVESVLLLLILPCR